MLDRKGWLDDECTLLTYREQNNLDLIGQNHVHKLFTLGYLLFTSQYVVNKYFVCLQGCHSSVRRLYGS